jgi:ribosomal protein S18 acetylase RimI-like enzyme
MLDATPAGEALYRSFGFQVLWRLTRWRREARAEDVAAEAAQGTLDRLLALDAAALGFDRVRVLRDLSERPGSQIVTADRAAALVRAGRTARHLGPILAYSDMAAAQLLARVAGFDASALLIDVPDDRPSMQRTLEACGFRPERPYAPMALAAPGLDLPVGNTYLIHAIAGPEYA